MVAPSLPRRVAVPGTAAPRFGLESVVQWLPADDHVFMGVQFEHLRCDAAHITAALQCDDADESPFGVPKTTTPGVPLVKASPFAVYGEYECNPVARPLSEAFELASAHLESGRGRAIERAVQFGEAGNEPTLANDAVDITPAGGPVSLVDAIARLEQYLGANYGGTGVLHMDRRLAAHAISDYLVVPVGDTLQTSLGTLVAAGAGYDNAFGPDESPSESPAAGSIWIYATGAVYGWRSDVGYIPDSPSGAVDRSTNTLRVLAEQTFVVAWECVTAAIQVDPTALGIGGF
jgi:hypothetical protein